MRPFPRFLSVFWAATAAILAQPAPNRGMLQSVTEIRPVTLAEPFHFWRNGKEETARDVVLIRVKVRDISEFAPMGIASPLFVFGDAVCLTLVDPLSTGEAILAAPRPAAGQATALWLADPGLPPQHLTAERVRTLRARAQRAEIARSIQVAAPPAAARPVQFANMQALAGSVTPPKTPR